MNLYEIDKAIEDLIDPETGELLDFEAFEALQMERERKIDNMIKMIKNQLALANEISEEITALHLRANKAINRANSIKEYLTRILNGEKYVSKSGEVSYRTSKSVSIDDKFIEWAKENRPDLITVKEPVITADKMAIKEIFKNDPSTAETIPYVEIVANTNTIIK